MNYKNESGKGNQNCTFIFVQIAFYGTMLHTLCLFVYANTLHLCHLNYINNFMYTLIDHTFDHTVIVQFV